MKQVTKKPNNYKMLGLDLSTKTGFAIINSDGLIEEQGTLREKSQKPLLLPEEFLFVRRAWSLSDQIYDLVKKYKPTHIFIEQTNFGRSRSSQKLLEFIHFAVLDMLIDNGYQERTFYVDSSRWKSRLGIKLTKEDRERNKLVKAKKAKGKITNKHLSVRWANQNFGLKLLLKDNDAADAMALAMYGLLTLTESNKSNNLDEWLDEALEIDD